MPLATRIIPQLLCNGRQLIKGQQYDSWRSVGVAAQAARIHNMRGVDELILLDIAATRENRGPDLALVEELASQCFMPLSVGGGVRSLQDIRDLLLHGADKVVIGAGAIEVPHLIRDAAFKFGSQCITVSIDYKDHEVHIRNGQVSTGKKPVDYARWAESQGAGEILLNAIDLEGTQQGYDLTTTIVVSLGVDIPVITSGGCSGYEDMLAAIQAGASAVSVGALFQFTESTPRGAAQFLHDNNVEARL